MAEDLKSKPPVAVTNAVSRRAEGIKHKKNEIFWDVVKKPVGSCKWYHPALGNSGCNQKMKSFLLGMPKLNKHGLNDKLTFGIGRIRLKQGKP